MKFYSWIGVIILGMAIKRIVCGAQYVRGNIGKILNSTDNLSKDREQTNHENTKFNKLIKIVEQENKQGKNEDYNKITSTVPNRIKYFNSRNYDVFPLSQSCGDVGGTFGIVKKTITKTCKWAKDESRCQKKIEGYDDLHVEDLCPKKCDASSNGDDSKDSFEVVKRSKEKKCGVIKKSECDSYIYGSTDKVMDRCKMRCGKC